MAWFIPNCETYFRLSTFWCCLRWGTNQERNYRIYCGFRRLFLVVNHYFLKTYVRLTIEDLTFFWAQNKFTVSEPGMAGEVLRNVSICFESWELCLDCGINNFQEKIYILSCNKNCVIVSWREWYVSKYKTSCWLIEFLESDAFLLFIVPDDYSEVTSICYIG